MSPQDQPLDDQLATEPERIIRNTIRDCQVKQVETHNYIRAGARVLSSLVDPALDTDTIIELIIGAKSSGILSTQKIVDEAAMIDPGLADAWKFKSRWQLMQDYLMDLLSYVLKDENWRHHTREAAEELVTLAEDRKSGRNTLSVAEVIDRVCRLDQEKFHDSPGYILHLLLAPAARPEGRVAHAVCGMYGQVIERWREACENSFDKFDITLRPDITFEDFARALTVVADGAALQSISTSGKLDESSKSEVSLLAKTVMMMLVGVVDTQKSGVPLIEAANLMLADGGT